MFSSYSFLIHYLVLSLTIVKEPPSFNHPNGTNDDEARRRHEEMLYSQRSIFVGSNLIHEPMTTVLLWTFYHNSHPLTAVEDWGRRISEGVAHCPVRCQFTGNRIVLDSADAVVFYATNINKQDLPPFHANNRQMWIFLEEEPPKRSRWDLHDLPNMFNWTMSYRRDSDVYHPYGLVIPMNHFGPATPMSKEYETFLTNKPKLAAWTVSNCLSWSKREQLVIEMRKYVQVDVYGRCSSDFHPCIETWPDGCMNEIEQQYKFYLALENSLCGHYVSEKFFHALARNIVPVVYGLEDYSQIAPPGSFIDARAYPTVKDLANYLLHLDKTPEAYLKYFEWKNSYKVIPKGVGWCNLCQKLRRRDSNPSSSSPSAYSDIWSWWNYFNLSSIDDNGPAKHNTGYANQFSSGKACLEPRDFLW